MILSSRLRAAAPAAYRPNQPVTLDILRALRTPLSCAAHHVTNPRGCDIVRGCQSKPLTQSKRLRTPTP